METILVVDDIRANRLVAAGFLEAEGYAVRLCESGEDAIRCFGEMAPDLVILDLLMPGMDGFETCEALRKLPGGNEVPIVFLTALSDLTVHAMALESGADDFLTKPIQRIELLMRVRSLLRIKRLTSEIASANTVLEAQRDALIEATLSRHRIAAMIVHDLKTPLASILGNARYITDTKGLLDDTKAAAEDVTECGERLHRMLLDLLDISRAEETKLVPRMSSFEALPLLRECTSTLRRAAEDRQCRLVIEAEPGLRMYADRDLLRRLLENLTDNALGHSPRQGTVTLSATRDDGGVRIAVRDEGQGIEPSARNEVFMPFVQLESGTKRRGTRGLGLAFCKLVADAHQGRIWVEEAKPKGSIFCATFPDQVRETVLAQSQSMPS